MRRIRSGGFTLIEVLMALAIFAIGSLGALAMMMSISDVNANAAQTTESEEIADWLLEQFEVRPTTDTTIVSDGVEVPASAAALKATGMATISIPDTLSPTGLSAQPAVRYQVRWISDVQTGAGANVRHWRVRVRWPKNREARMLSPGQPGYVDCYDAATFTAGACMSNDYHTYRKLS